MAMVSVVKWQPSGGLWLKSIGLLQRSTGTWHCAEFITWTGWTLAML